MDLPLLSAFKRLDIANNKPRKEDVSTEVYIVTYTHDEGTGLCNAKHNNLLMLLNSIVPDKGIVVVKEIYIEKKVMLAEGIPQESLANNDLSMITGRFGGTPIVTLKLHGEIQDKWRNNHIGYIFNIMKEAGFNDANFVAYVGSLNEGDLALTLDVANALQQKFDARRPNLLRIEGAGTESWDLTRDPNAKPSQDVAQKIVDHIHTQMHKTYENLEKKVVVIGVLVNENITETPDTKDKLVIVFHIIGDIVLDDDFRNNMIGRFMTSGVYGQSDLYKLKTALGCDIEYRFDPDVKRKFTFHHMNFLCILPLFETDDQKLARFSKNYYDDKVRVFFGTITSYLSGKNPEKDLYSCKNRLYLVDKNESYNIGISFAFYDASEDYTQELVKMVQNDTSLIPTTGWKKIDGSNSETVDFTLNSVIITFTRDSTRRMPTGVKFTIDGVNVRFEAGTTNSGWKTILNKLYPVKTGDGASVAVNPKRDKEIEKKKLVKDIQKNANKPTNAPGAAKKAANVSTSNPQYQ